MRAARKQKQGVSAPMKDVARHQLALREGLAAVAEWENEHGALSEQELDAARERMRRG